MEERECMFNRLHFFVVITIITGFIQTEASLPSAENLSKFISKYDCPMIKDGFNKDKKCWRNFVGIKPTTITKGAKVSRMINAIRIKQVIKDSNLNLLDVPQKCLIKENVQFEDWSRSIPWGYHDTWSVVAQAVQGDAVKNITVPEIQQLVTFVEKTGFQDFAAHDMNMLRDKKTNKIIFIDTEDASFWNARARTRLALVANVIRYVSPAMTKDACDWLHQYYEQVTLSGDNSSIVPIYYNCGFDDADINFEKVKQEYKELEGDC